MNSIMFKRAFMRKLFLLIVPLAGLLAVFGCSNPSSSSSQDPIVGTWSLTSLTIGGVPTTL